VVNIKTEINDYAHPNDTTEKYENNYYTKIKANYRDFMKQEDMIQNGKLIRIINFRI
jgi:hypothetical protein